MQSHKHWIFLHLLCIDIKKNVGLFNVSLHIESLLFIRNYRYTVYTVDCDYVYFIWCHIYIFLTTFEYMSSKIVPTYSKCFSSASSIIEIFRLPRITHVYER